MKEKVLVTGGAGYIGSHLSNILLDAGYKVKVFDNLLYGQKLDANLSNNNSYEFINGDIRDVKLIEKSLQDVDYIVHLASLTGEPACLKNTELCNSINTQAVQILNEVRSGLPIIFASSTSIYGETGKRHCTEETIPTPALPYSISKYESEKLLSKSENVVIFRPATAFGISFRHRLDLLINDFVFNAVKYNLIKVYDPNVLRTFVSVQDLAKAYLLAIEKFKLFSGGIYNVGFDHLNLDKQTIVDEIKKQTNCEVIVEKNRKDNDNRNFTVDYSKIKKLGFSETIGLVRGIDDMVRCYREIISDPSHYCVNFNQI
ncbi:MAG: NAD(P)-dependent oxidoreductase [bacterium]|nr:NAD(P)-dependent oxidoreductase [bacterium]